MTLSEDSETITPRTRRVRGRVRVLLVINLRFGTLLDAFEEEDVASPECLTFALAG